MKQKVLVLIVFISISCLMAQTFEGLYKGYKKYLNNVSNSILSAFYFKAKTSKKIVAITFDDGPFRNTPSLISFLVKENIPATFFLVAKSITPKYSDLYNNSLLTIGIHTYKHSDYRSLNYNEKKEDIEHSLKILKERNLSTSYFRPTYGIIDRDLTILLKENNLKGVLWSIDSQDWNGYKGKKLSNNIMKHLTGGDIILFHDSTSIQDLKNVVNTIKNNGYKIVSLDEIMTYKNDF